jgi:hypothetical protein
VGGVALLPEELLGPEEHLRVRRLPPDDRTPLVEPHGEVAVAPDPLAHKRRDDGLAGGPEGESLLQFLVAAVSDPRDFGVEAVHDVALAFEVALGDERGEVGVLRAGLLEPLVEVVLDALPEGVPAGPGDDEPTHGRVVGEFGLLDDLCVPVAGRVLLALGDSEFLLVVAH